MVILYRRLLHPSFLLLFCHLKPALGSSERNLSQPWHMLLLRSVPFHLMFSYSNKKFETKDSSAPPASFLGSSKRRRKEETTGKNVKRTQHELDHNGLVPLPVKVCFTCNRYFFLCLYSANAVVYVFVFPPYPFKSCVLMWAAHILMV